MKNLKETVNGINIEYRGLNESTVCKLQKLVMLHYPLSKNIDFLRWDNTEIAPPFSITLDYVICIFKLKKLK